jgi:group I intron endonuclease
MNVYYNIKFSYLIECKNKIIKYLHENFNYNGDPIIYGIHNIINDKWYIGQTKDLYQRLWNTRNNEGHCQMVISGTHFINNEGGVDNFEFVILELCDYNSLDSMESYYVNKYNSYNNGYNKSKDGKGRWQKNLVYWINPNTRDEVRLPIGIKPPNGEYINSNTTLGRICYYNPSTKEMVKLLESDPIPSGFIKGNIIKGRKVYRNNITGDVIRLSPGENIPLGYTVGNNTTNKIRVYSIINKSRYTLSVDEIKSSCIEDFRYGCPRGEFWNDPKWINKCIINKNEI